MANEKKTVTIIVEATPHTWPKGDITYEQVVQLEVPGYTSESQVTYSVTYAKANGNKEGILYPGESVKTKEGMEFHVSETGQS